MVGIVIDTCVFVAALRSQTGASYQVLLRSGSGAFDVYLSVPMVLEFEEVAKRERDKLGLTLEAIDDILDYLCSVAQQREIHFLWRPCLPDSDDDMVLELAVAGQCSRIVTFNVRDFRGSDKFGVRAITPQAFLRELEE